MSASDYVSFATHEYIAHYLYTDHGRQPYFAIGRLVDATGGAGEWTIDGLDGATWKVELTYNANTGLRPREDDNVPADKPMYEYWIKARPVAEDNRKKASFNISPRWRDQQTINDEDLGTPFDHDTVHHPDKGELQMPDEGVNVKVQTSNVEAQIVPGIFAHFVDEIANRLSVNLRDGLFDSFHPISNVNQIEGYCRYHRDLQNQITSQDGILFRLFHLVGDQLGNRAEYFADNEEIRGHLHNVTLQDGNPSVLVSEHRLRKRWKSYHPKTVRENNNNPLYHPKFGVSVVSKWQDKTMYVSQLDEIEHEIEQSGLNLLEWAGIDTDPETGPWVPDDHFEPQPTDRDITIESDPLPAIEVEQDAQLLRAFAEGTDADQDMLGDLAANGGTQHYHEFEYASSTVYRLKERLPDLVESDNGLIRLRSQKLKEDLNDILNRAEREIGRLAESIANVLDIDGRYLEAVENELERFMQKYSIDFQEHDSKIMADVGATLTELKSFSDDYPRVQALLYRLKRLLGGSQAFQDAKPVLVQYENLAGDTKIRRLNSAPAARPM